MNKVKREVECLSRYKTLNGSCDDMLEFLLAESVITKDEVKLIRGDADPIKAIQALLSNLSKESKLQLLEYEWTILPVERIKILIITDKNRREFTYNT